MKVVMLSGSRNREGRTARSIEAIGKGITKAGSDFESIFLTELAIERCRQCNKDGTGICGRDGTCLINDDFDPLVAKLKAADVVVFANPVYFGEICESMRAFLDRLRRISRPVPRRPEPGQTPPPPPKPLFDGISALGLCMAGGSGGNAPSCCVSLEKAIQGCGFDVVDMIPVRRQNLDFKLPILELTGQWLATKPTSGKPMPRH